MLRKISPSFVYTIYADSNKERLQSLRTWDEHTEKMDEYWKSEEGKLKWAENGKKAIEDITKYSEEKSVHEMSLGFDFMSFHDGLVELCDWCNNNTSNRILERLNSNGGCCSSSYHTIYYNETPARDDEFDSLIDRWLDGEGEGTQPWEWLGWSFEKYIERVGGGKLVKVWDHDIEDIIKHVKRLYALCTDEQKEKLKRGCDALHSN